MTPKYVHIMPHPSTIYNRQIVEMINDNPDYFNPDEHLFVIAHEKTYADVKQFPNTIHEPKLLEDSKVIKKYATEARWIFLHENYLPLKVLLPLQKKTFSKIIWCVWGHDLYNNVEKISLLHSAKKYIGKIIRDHITKKYYAIGIGFEYDNIEIRKKYGDIRIVHTPYGYVKGQKQFIDKVLGKTTTHQYTKVMIGHSAYPFLNHERILDLLAKYKDEDIVISLVLAYGEKDYAKRIQDKAIGIFGKDKVEINQELSAREDYIKYLDTIDICIFDFAIQAALGNFYLLCYMKKKFFLNKDGILKIAADSEKMETYTTDQISTMDFDTFRKPLSNTVNEYKFGDKYINDDNYLVAWRDTLNALNDAK